MFKLVLGTVLLLGFLVATGGITCAAGPVSAGSGGVTRVGGSTEKLTPLAVVTTRYKIIVNAGKYVIPPTGKELTLGERLVIIKMVAANYGIPYQVLGAICFQEGWDRYTGERCKSWYDNGGIVTSVSRALCAFQIWPPAHPEVNVKKLETDFTYCVEQAARILVAKRGPKSSTDPLAWEESVKAYFGVGKPQTQSYWQAVLSFIKNPPIVDGVQAW